LALLAVADMRSHGRMLNVKVTVAVGARKVSADDLNDLRAARMLKEAGQDVGNKLSKLTCPVHGKGPANVRMHFDKNGVADLQYESCCEELGKKIGAALG
jgi:hypothetical protein